MLLNLSWPAVSQKSETIQTIQTMIMAAAGDSDFHMGREEEERKKYTYIKFIASNILSWFSYYFHFKHVVKAGESVSNM